MSFLSIEPPTATHRALRAPKGGFASFPPSRVGAAIELLRSSALTRLWLARRATALGALLSARPEVWQLARSPFIHAGWRPKERLERLIDHCAISDLLGSPFNLAVNHYADLLTLDEIGPGYKLKLDNPHWILRDGLLTLSIWDETDRLFSVHFLFGYEGDHTVAYIGGIQGRRGDNAREQYRAFARGAAEMHPSHVLVELFRSLCADIGIKRILAVSNESRHQRAAYYSRRSGYSDPVLLDYDALWQERGGTPIDGLYELPLVLPKRDLATIPRSKRGRYAARRAFLALLQDRLSNVLEHPEDIRVIRHAPEAAVGPGLDWKVQAASTL